MRQSQSLLPRRSVWHGTAANFEAFDLARCLGAHFGTYKAAQDRLRDTGQGRIEWVCEQAPDGWYACEAAANGLRRGPFGCEAAAEIFIQDNPRRLPIEFEIDIARPVQMPDLGVWTFETVCGQLRRDERFPGFCLHEPAIWEAWNRSAEEGWAAVKTVLRHAGFDSIAYCNETEDSGSLSWIVLDAADIHRVRWRVPQHQRPGAAVGAGRWPQPLVEGARPWRGRVLSREDPVAWAGSRVFPRRADQIDPEEIRQYLMRRERTNQAVKEVPVLWESDVGPTVQWIDPVLLSPYEQDVLHWVRALARRNQACPDAAEQVVAGHVLAEPPNEAPPERRPEPMRA